MTCSDRLEATRNGVTTRYIYDASGRLLAEADGANNITRYYIYGKGLMAMVTSAGALYCYHYNAVGSTIAMTDANKVVTNKYAYDSFGNISSEVEAVKDQLFKYVGQHGVMTETDAGKTFYYMKARYYDPKIGRFISEDPIGFGGGDVNVYAYVANNPVMYIDPNGQFHDPGDGACIIAGFAMLFSAAADALFAAVIIHYTLLEGGLPALVAFDHVSWALFFLIDKAAVDLYLSWVLLNEGFTDDHFFNEDVATIISNSEGYNTYAQNAALNSGSIGGGFDIGPIKP